MKPTSASSGKLRKAIQDRWVESGLNYSQIGTAANVHPSQVSRICRGKFRTLSHNVLQVCKVLGLDVETLATAESGDLYRKRLEDSVLDIWDRTPQDADRLVRLLHQLAELRRSGGGGR